MLDLFPYQVEGAEWLVAHKRGALHDEMGTGKTATTIRALDMIDARRIIVICPGMVRENWVTEFRKFSQRNLIVCKAMDINDYYAWQRGYFHVLVASYALIAKWAPIIWERGELLDAVVIDEGHYIKNPGAARTKAILGPNYDGYGGVISLASYAWMLTGTPIPNAPIDIYTFLKFSHSVGSMSRAQFQTRYFTRRNQARGVERGPRPELLEELTSKINTTALRRTKKDVGLQLPPIFLTSTLIEGDNKEIEEHLAEHPELKQAILNAMDRSGMSDAALATPRVSTLRRLVGLAKMVPYAEMLYQELESGGADKRVVFGLHVDVLKGLEAFLIRKGIKTVRVAGDTPEPRRVQAVQSFQNEPNCRVFLGNINSAGVGITLTAACEVDILESSWTPAQNAQSIMRVHRPGQTREAHARFITLASSVDETVNSVVAAKTEAIAAIEGEKMLTMAS